MNDNSNEQQTYEGRKETHNGIKRMIFVGIALLIEIVLVLLLFTKLWDYAEWINIGMRILALVLVLGIYAQNKTAAMKISVFLETFWPTISVKTALFRKNAISTTSSSS